jgi:hypothetical protein
MQIQAIETVYRGYRFRSRLEARWAVFFDTLGIDFDYEPEGYDLAAAGYYLPDFYLPDLKLWMEMKPMPATHDEMWKAKTFAELSGQNIAIVQGRITTPTLGYTDYGDPFYLSAASYDATLFYGNFEGVSGGDLFLMGYDTLGEWIRDTGHEADDFDGTIESARRLRQMDYEIQTKFGNHKVAARHQYGVVCTGNIWVRPDDRYLLLRKDIFGEYALDGLLPRAYQRAQQARFEHGETP